MYNVCKRENGVVRIGRKEVTIDVLSIIIGKNLREVLGITPSQDRAPCEEKPEASSIPYPTTHDHQL